MKREKLEQMLLDKIKDEYIEVDGVEVEYYIFDTYTEDKCIGNLELVRIYKDGTIVAIDSEEGMEDEFAIYELTADSIINLLNDEELWEGK